MDGIFGGFLFLCFNYFFWCGVVMGVVGVLVVGVLEGVWVSGVFVY